MQGFSANLNQNKSIYLLQPLKKACKVILKIHFIRQCIRQLISMHIFEGDNIQLENSWSECTLENVYCEKASWKVAWCTEHFSLLQQLKCSENNATLKEANFLGLTSSKAALFSEHFNCHSRMECSVHHATFLEACQYRFHYRWRCGYFWIWF